MIKSRPAVGVVPISTDVLDRDHGTRTWARVSRVWLTNCFQGKVEIQHSEKKTKTKTNDAKCVRYSQELCILAKLQNENSRIIQAKRKSEKLHGYVSKNRNSTL